MKRIGIIGAMDIEIQLIKDKMTIIGEELHAGFKVFIGKFKDIEIILTSCGVGKVNASCCTQLLVDKFGVEGVINTGIAGSLNSKVKVCDIVISDNVTYHDVRKSQMKTFFPYKEHFTASEKLRDIAIRAYEKITERNYNYHIGRIVTGEAFISDNQLKNTIIKNYAPYCVEMEGAAIGHVAEINDVPFIIIRSISDNADSEATISYDEFETIASNNSAELVLNMLELINC